MSIKQSVKEFSFIFYFLFSHNFCDLCASAPLGGGDLISHIGRNPSLNLPQNMGNVKSPHFVKFPTTASNCLLPSTYLIFFNYFLAFSLILSTYTCSLLVFADPLCN